GRVHRRGAVELERQENPRAPRRCAVAGIEAADEVDAVPDELKPARQGSLDVWLCVGLGWDSEAELSVEGQRPCHVGDYDADDTELWGGHREPLSGGMLKGRPAPSF